MSRKSDLGFAAMTCINQRPKAHRLNPFQRDALWPRGVPL